MQPFITVQVSSQDGLRGSADLPLEPGDEVSQILLTLEDGRQVFVPFSLLEARPDGEYYLPVDVAGLVESQDVSLAGAESGPVEREQNDGDVVHVIPVIEEELDIHKREYTTGGVRVTKHIEERQELIDEPGFREEVDVQRVPINRPLEQPLSPYVEGETMVIPLMEEVLVVEKRLILKEELRITRRRVETRNPQQVTLRREEVSIDSLSGDEDRGSD